MSSTAMPTVVREGDVIAVAVDGQSISMSAPQAKHMARAINNVVSDPQAKGVAESWAGLINRVRIQVSKKVAEKYLTNTGREADTNGMIAGAVVRTGHATFIADQAEASGDLVILHTPLETVGGRVAVPASAICHVSFDGE